MMVFQCVKCKRWMPFNELAEGLCTRCRPALKTAEEEKFDRLYAPTPSDDDQVDPDFEDTMGC